MRRLFGQDEISISSTNTKSKKKYLPFPCPVLCLCLAKGFALFEMAITRRDYGRFRFQGYCFKARLLVFLELIFGITHAHVQKMFMPLKTELARK